MSYLEPLKKLYFDFPRTNTGGKHRVRDLEEHITIVEDIVSKYIGHVSPLVSTF